MPGAIPPLDKVIFLLAVGGGRLPNSLKAFSEPRISRELCGVTERLFPKSWLRPELVNDVSRGLRPAALDDPDLGALGEYDGLSFLGDDRIPAKF